MTRPWIAALALVACGAPRAAGTRPEVEPEAEIDRCALEAEPAIIARDGDAVLERFDLPAAAIWSQAVLPDDPGYARFRQVIREAGAETTRPVADEPAAKTEQERQIWARERRNAERLHGGELGEIRPISCLEALLFARQHARRDQLEHPTELIASILERGDRLRVYVGAGSEMFPPKAVYGLMQVEVDVADGWQLVAVLHNHTIQTYRGKPALGEPVPSTSDVGLLRGVAAKLGMREARVTNGVYTGVVSAAGLDRLETR